MYDNKTKAIRALPVAAKGTDEEAVKWWFDIIEEMGYVGEKIVLKSDQEPSILALKRAVAVTRDGQTCPIESPVRESKFIGAMVRAVRIWQGQMRTMRSCFETRMQKKLPADNVLTNWMALWAADMMNKCHVHTNGRTTPDMITSHT